MRKEKKNNCFFLLLLVFFIIIRLFAINQPIFDDETNYVQSINDPGPYYTIKPFQIHKHPPLGGWIFFLVGNTLGQEEWIYRLVPLLFWTINITLVYLIVSKEYSQRAALFSSLIMGLSFYSILMSLQIDIEGSILITSFLLISLFYFKHLKKENEENKIKRKWLVLTGIALGMALLTKITAIFFIGIIGIYSFINIGKGEKIFSTKHIKKILFEFMFVLLVGLLVFSIFPILTLNLFLQMFGHSSNYVGLNISWMAISMLLFWATPLLLGLFLFRVSKSRRKDLFWTIWFFLFFFIYTFLIIGRTGTHGASGGVADYSRHFMNLIIPFSILGGVFLSKIKVSRKQLLSGIVIGIISLVNFLIINLKTSLVLPRYFNIYFNAIKSFNFNFLFSFTTSSGNLMGINMGILVFNVFISIILIAGYFLFKYLKRYNLSKWVLVVFIALGVSLNAFLAIEYLGHISGPDINNVFNEMVDYVKENDVKEQIYVNNEGLLLKINDLKIEQGNHQFKLGNYFEGLSKHDSIEGIVLFLNWPTLHEENNIYKILKKCKIKKQFYSKDILIGEIYVC